ncbi:MAG TPA: glycosyl transferase family protein [Bryobacteraceae bacterium]|nr:glycosyl transferase family protein [Bryobacteraceae bacterium]
MHSILFPLELLDLWVGALLIPVALWILLSGIDDVFIDVVCLTAWLRNLVMRRQDGAAPDHTAALEAPQKRIAIMVPLWKEDAVIRQMVENNVANIEYRRYDFFLGTYPNDHATLAAVNELEHQFANVHAAVCGNDGPTSKADCLNWVYQRMLAFEREHQDRFEVIVTHDAEDVIHPQALHWINYYCDVYDMVQVPVLPLPTPMKSWTHGLYCDEFAEFQLKDMPARQILGGFIPSNGVGTGFTRWGLDQLAAGDGHIFEPECLTEDYENGLRLHFLGCPQLFLPVRLHQGKPMATREYFPQTIASAIRQRTRWVTGIALQSWERHGWRGGAGSRYWMWRDRKGLIGNPVSMLTSAIFLYGLTTWVWSSASGTAWGMRAFTNSWETQWLIGSTTALQAVHLSARAWCTSRVYGWRFAAGVPLRALLGNYVNFRATAGAVRRYLMARLRRHPLVWLKTDHCYPVLASASHRRPLGEILVSCGRLTKEQLQWALRTKPGGLRLGEYLIRARLITEEQVYQALSLQASVPFFHLDPRRVRRSIARALPGHVIESWRVLPFQVAGGYLYVATSDAPEPGLVSELERFTRLTPRVQLVTATNFAQLRRELL